MPRFLPSLLLPLFLHFPVQAQELMPQLDQQALAWLGDRIFANECNRQPRCLTSWNDGEDFPSLGLGHFIWYRAGQQERFVETFPALLLQLRDEGTPLPAWILLNDFEQPWPDRASFVAALDAPELSELRSLLESTMDRQTRFIVQRFDAGLAALLAAQDAAQRQAIEQHIARMLAQDPRLGSYALIDYVHFKGEGTSAAERYDGQGWGLLQVLQGMPGSSQDPLAEFVASARQVLAARVAKAPAERNEARWLEGWYRRLDTYLDATGLPQ